jgi:hypothetical protein
MPAFGPDGREQQGGGVGSRKEPGKRGARGGVRRDFLPLGDGSKENAGANGAGAGSRGCLAVIMARPGPSWPGLCRASALAPRAEKILPPRASQRVGLGGRGGLAVRGEVGK